VHSYDIDPININLANDMLKESFEDRIGMFELINIDLKTWKIKENSKIYDMVLMNPPFGK
jgi:tRNA1(Val) A37 N6-methylase TrmN6